MARFQARPELDLCVTLIQNFWVPELSDEAEHFRGHPRGRPLPGYTPVTLLTRRALFETVGRFNPALRHGDATEWFLRAAEWGAMLELLPEVLVYRRLHQANLSRIRAADSRDEYVRIIKRSLDRRRAPGQSAPVKNQARAPGGPSR